MSNTDENGNRAHDPAFILIMNLQQRQLEMQQQMAALMTRLVPPTTTNVIPTPNITTSRAKIERPIIDADCSDNRWVIFTDSWRRYKEMVKLTTNVDI